MRSFFAAKSLPEYYDRLLLVKLARNAPSRISSIQSAVSDSGLPSASDYRQSPGLVSMLNLERAGLIAKITSINAVPSNRFERLRPLMFGFNRESLGSGVSLVELKRNADVGALQLSLANDPDIVYASRVPVRYLSGIPTRGSVLGAPAARILATPPSPSSLWNLNTIRVREARALPGFEDATNIRVAVLDTGVDDEHPDLIDQLASYTHGHNDLDIACSDEDIVGHGTHVSGTIAATLNSIGIDGICKCKLYVHKIFGDDPYFFENDNEYGYVVDPVLYLRALSACVDQGIDVLNLSIGGYGTPDTFELEAFSRLLASGTTIVAAMGNDATSRPSYPAAVTGVIAVGATKLGDSRAAFSNVGSHISISAPGVDIWSSLPSYAGQTGFKNGGSRGDTPRLGEPFSRDTDYDSWQGTSMASPHVAGAAALLLANGGDWTPAAVRQHLMKTADKVDEMEGEDFHPSFGSGRLNVERALYEPIE